jgi:hypothetical protein
VQATTGRRRKTPSPREVAIASPDPGFTCCQAPSLFNPTSLLSHRIDLVVFIVSSSDRVEAAYRRGDLFEKRAWLMADWAKYCTSPPVQAGADVVPMRAGATTATARCPAGDPGAL